MAKRIGNRQDPPADSFERLIRAFERLPGVGRRSAERMAYHLLNVSYEEAMGLAVAVRDVKKNLHPCKECGDLTEGEQCGICQDPRRDTSLLCVVEWPKDVRAIEKTATFRGRYHVLMGRLSPLSGIGPEDLRLGNVFARIKGGDIREVLVATSPTAEGDATANYIREEALKRKADLSVTRLARGLPEGSELSLSQSGTIGEAIRGRRELGR